MKKSNMNLTFNSSRKGMVLPIILLVIFLLVGAGVGGYYLVDTFVLFPDVDDNPWEEVLEHKFGFGFEYEPAEDQGKVDLSMKITEESIRNYVKSMSPDSSESDIEEMVEQLKANLPYDLNDEIIDAEVSYTKDEYMANLSLMGENVSIISSKDDLVVGMGEKNYGLSLKNFTDDLANSIFAPGSGSPAELPQETYDMLLDFYDSFMAAKDREGFEADVEIIEDMILDCFINSKLGACEVKFFDNTFNGAPHAGRSQNFVFNREGFIDFIEVLSARLGTLSAEEAAALDRILGLTSLFTGDAKPLTEADLIDSLNSAVNDMKESEIEADGRIELSIIYVAKNIAAIEANVYSTDLETQEETHELYVGLDFGDDPLKNGKATFIFRTFDEERPTIVNVESNKVVEGGKTTISVVFNTTMYNYVEDPVTGAYVSKVRGDQYFYADITADKDAGLITLDIDQQMLNNPETETERLDVLKVVLGYSDSKDNLSFTFDRVEQDDITFALPYEISVGFSNTPDEIVIPDYDNILEYDETAFQEFFNDIRGFLGGLLGGTSPAPTSPNY